jgi:positive regulator of sigma E activity
MTQNKSFKDKVLDYVYILSKQPILLKDLLDANIQYNEGLHVDPVKLGFRLKLRHAYLVYIILVLIVLIPLSGIAHQALSGVDPHISILGAMIVTAAVFIGFNFFRSKLRDEITLRQIKKSWKLRFPYFPYEEYTKKVEKIYENAIKEEISKKDLEKYILDNLVKEE